MSVVCSGGVKLSAVPIFCHIIAKAEKVKPTGVKL